MNTLVFSESQRMKMWWVYAVCVAIAVVAAWAFIQQIILQNPFGTKPAPDAVLYIMLLLSFLLLLLIMTVRLKLRINEKGVHVHYFPFLKRFYQWSQIVSFEVVEYDPLKDFGGWGIRHNWKQKSKAFTVSGHHGLSLLMNDGRKVIIGTYKPEKLKVFLKQLAFKHN